MMTIEQFCDLHDACIDGREWALANCRTMQDVWDTAPLEYLNWVATRPGVLTYRELRLFAASCARSVLHLTTDPRSHAAVAVAERYAFGDATDEELAAARDAAEAAADAADDAAGSPYASWYAARAAHAAWLRANTTPCFQVPGGRRNG